MRLTPPRPVPALLLLLACATLSAPATARAVPAFPGKAGPVAPREGFSGTARRPGLAAAPDGVSGAPALGAVTYRTLAIRVAFSDAPIESSDAYYNRILFFLNQYWSQVTAGRYVVQPDLHPNVYTLPHPMAYYGDDDRFQERLVFLVRDAVALADTAVNFAAYQSVILFHAGQGQETDVRDNSRHQLWSAFVTPSDFETILPDTAGAVGIRTDDFVGANPYYLMETVVLPESESQDNYQFGMLGVTAHEYGHQLGLPDLYDTNGEEGGHNQGIGSWDIMAQGVWNANGFVPAGPCAWTRNRLDPFGFVPARIADSATVSLAHLARPIGALPRAALVPITQSEYFLLENRAHDLDGDSLFSFDDVDGDRCFDFYTDSYAGAEFDFFLPATLAAAGPPCGGRPQPKYQSGSGVLIYHVDEAKITATVGDNLVEADTERKGIDLVEADGIEDLDEAPSAFNGGSPADVFRRFYRDRFTPDTTPGTEAYGHIRTGISITGIGPANPAREADSVMTFHVAFDRNRPGWPVLFPVNNIIHSIPPLAADLDGDGIRELLVPIQRLSNQGALYAMEPDGTDLLGGPDLNPATRDAFATPRVVGSTGNPVTVPVTSTPCVGDIDGDGGNDVVFSAQNGAIFAYRADGTEVYDGDGNAGTVGVLVPGTVPGTPGFGVRTQPILTDLDGDGTMEVVYGWKSTLNAAKVTSGGILGYTLPLAGAAERPAAAGDLDGDGFPEVIIAVEARAGAEDDANGLSIANWEIFTDPLASSDPLDYLVVGGGPFSAPVMADLDADGRPEVLVSEASGSVHALSFTLLAHIPGDPPGLYTRVRELDGWPVSGVPTPGIASEVSLGDLEEDGHPEVFHMGGETRVAALHYNGAPRSGYPLRTADPLAAQDSAGVWPPLIADADGDGRADVLPLIPDGRRLAFRGDGTPISGFGELGSTSGPPPMLVDLDADGTAEWVEAFTLGNQAMVSVRSMPVPVRSASVGWPQYRFGPTRDGLFPALPGGGGGTPILSQVYGYPNPSRDGSTTIHYHLGAQARDVRIRIVDPAGSTVAELPTGPPNRAGSAEHRVVWAHAGIASGPYLCRVEAVTDRGTEVRFAKLAIVR